MSIVERGLEDLLPLGEHVVLDLSTGMRYVVIDLDSLLLGDAVARTVLRPLEFPFETHAELRDVLGRSVVTVRKARWPVQ